MSRQPYEPYSTYSPLPKQRAWHKASSKHQVVAFIGGLGSGKTLALCQEALKMARINRGCLGIVAAPTYRMLDDTVIPTFFDFVCEEKKVKWSKSKMQVDFRNGSRIIFRSLEHPDRLRGPNAAWALVDEAPLCRERAFDIVLGRVRDPRAKLRQVKIVGNPRGYNWVYRRFVEDPQPGYKLIRTSTYENPTLPPEYISLLRSSYSASLAKQELGGEFISLEGMVYPFSRKLHVVEGLRERCEEQGLPLFAGMDLGWKNPTAVLDFHVSEFIDADGGADTEVYLTGEFYESFVSTERLADRLKSRDYEWVACDPAGRQRRQEADGKSMIRSLRARGAPRIRTRSEGIVTGIKVVSRFMQDDVGRVRFYVDSRCTNYIREVEAYTWQETPEGKPDRENPKEGEDHAMDAKRYFFVVRFPEYVARFKL